MREIPEAFCQAAQANRALRGKRISLARTGESAHKFTWYNDALPDIASAFEGRRFTEAAALGGILELRFEDARIALFDGSGPRYWEEGSQAPAKRQLYLAFDDGSALTSVTSMYGGVMAFGEEGLDNAYYRGNRDAPSPLTEAFTEERFREICEAAPLKTSMKALLATEQRIPGLGNGVLQDILFDARLHPKRKLENTDAAELRALYSSLKRVIKDMADAGGRDVEKDLFGNPGEYRTILSRLTLGKPCPVCGAPIEKAAYLGGAVYFCPHCQAI